MSVFLGSDEVSARIGDDDFRIVDVRDAWEFDGIGHLPSAVSIPFEEFRSAEGDEGMLPGTDPWAEMLSAAGIGPDDELLAYDDTHGVFAARFLVTALLYGHDPEKLHLLDGDYSSWSREHEVARDSPAVGTTTYEPGEPTDSPLVGYDAVEEAVDDDETLLLDTREAWEYDEGHLPGAVQLDWLELVDTEGTRGLRPSDELRSLLEDRGITPDRPTILYCNTARRISHTYLVLRHLGYENVGFYEGSLTEWEERGGPTVTETDS